MGSVASDDAGDELSSSPDVPRGAKGGRARNQELETQAQHAFAAAKAYSDSNLAPQRIAAQDAFHGEPYGDEEAGRSQVVDRSVRDIVRAYMPNVMRIFFGGRTIMEFLARTPADEPFAEQATDYINEIVVEQDNPGYLTFHSAFKDALTLRLGWFKWWWDEQREVKTYHYSGLDAARLQILSSTEDVAKMRVEKHDENPAAVTYDVWLTRDVPMIGKARFQCVPNEEIYFAPGSTSVQDTLAFFHSRSLPVNELVAMGYDRDECLEHALPVGATPSDPTTGTAAIEVLARTPGHTNPGNNGLLDDDLRPVRYTEAYTFKDMDGDGYAELLKVCAIGEPLYVVAWEPVDEVPFAYCTPDPEPHEMSGESVTDIVKDVQRIKTVAQRFMLDAFSQSVNPGWEVVEGQVDIDDLLNTETSRVVRVKAPGQLRELVPTATGQQMFNVLDYFDKVRDDRTKQTSMSQGLDGNQLQSTEKSAAASQLSAAQGDQELVARNLGETGVKRLFQGLLGLLVKHQDKPRTVKLRGTWTEIDPRVWDVGMQVQVNVGLGAGGIAEKTTRLLGALEKQELLLSTLGPTNPIAGLTEYYNTLTDLMALGGRKDSARYFKAPPANWQPQQPPADPATIVAQSTERIKANELQFQRDEAVAKLALQHDNDLRQAQLKRLQIEATYRATIYAAEIAAKQTAEQGQIDAQTDRMGQLLEAHTDIQDSAAGLIAQLHGNTAQAGAQVQSAQIAANAPPPAPGS